LGPIELGVSLKTVLMAAGFTAVSALFVFLSVVAPLGDLSTGLRVWNGKFLLGMGAAMFLCLAAVVLVRAHGGRSDSEFADSIDAPLSFPVYVYPQTREQIRAALPRTNPEGIPSRALLAVDEQGVAVWARPHFRHVRIPWSEVSAVVAIELTDRPINGLSVRLTGAERDVDFGLVGGGLLGTVSRGRALEMARRSRVIRP
jgi:hypothetical protein